MGCLESLLANLKHEIGNGGAGQEGRSVVIKDFSREGWGWPSSSSVFLFFFFFLASTCVQQQRTICTFETSVFWEFPGGLAVKGSPLLPRGWGQPLYTLDYRSKVML